jgi:hypothetical protein
MKKRQTSLVEARKPVLQNSKEKQQVETSISRQASYFTGGNKSMKSGSPLKTSKQPSQTKPINLRSSPMKVEEASERKSFRNPPILELNNSLMESVNIQTDAV